MESFGRGNVTKGACESIQKKHPAEIDFTGAFFAGLRPRQAICELDGDHLKLCLPFVGPNADPPRPSNFETEPQSKNVVLVYRRSSEA